MKEKYERLKVNSNYNFFLKDEGIQKRIKNLI